MRACHTSTRFPFYSIHLRIQCRTSLRVSFLGRRPEPELLPQGWARCVFCCSRATHAHPSYFQAFVVGGSAVALLLGSWIYSQHHVQKRNGTRNTRESHVHLRRALPLSFLASCIPPCGRFCSPSATMMWQPRCLVQPRLFPRFPRACYLEARRRITGILTLFLQTSSSRSTAGGTM